MKYIYKIILLISFVSSVYGASFEYPLPHRFPEPHKFLGGGLSPEVYQQTIKYYTHSDAHETAAALLKAFEPVYQDLKTFLASPGPQPIPSEQPLCIILGLNDQLQVEDAMEGNTDVVGMVKGLINARDWNSNRALGRFCKPGFRSRAYKDLVLKNRTFIEQVVDGRLPL